MRHLALWVAVLAGCGSAPGVDGGVDAGRGVDPVATCTPEGFTTAPSLVALVRVPGLDSADEHQAYAELDSNAGGTVTTSSVSIDLWNTTSDAGVPSVSVRFNGCDLGAPRTVPGVGVKFEGGGSAVWVPQPGRFVTFEVVGVEGALLYRDALPTPQVMPTITGVTSPMAQMSTVTWHAIPDAGVSEASIIAWRGPRSVGFANNVDVTTGSRAMTVSQGPDRVDFEVRLGTGLSKVRLVGQRSLP